MSDTQSLSQWEAVDDEDCEQQQRVVVEFPSEGIPNDSSQGTSSVKRKLDARDLKANTFTSDNSSASSSFVHVPNLKAPSLSSLNDSTCRSHTTVSNETYNYYCSSTDNDSNICNNSDASLSDNFEVLSLSSGNIVLRCKRCSRRLSQ